MTTTKDESALFLADIAWLGPILGAPFDDHGLLTVPIAGAEDPARGKAFAAALVPVVANAGGHYKRAEPDRLLHGISSDRYGWFGIPTPASLWEEGADGVLLVLLYSQAGDLEYYTYFDYDTTAQPDPDMPMVASHARSSARVLGPMPDPVKKRIEQAATDAIDLLLANQKTKVLRKGLAELRAPMFVTQKGGTRSAEPVAPPADGAELVFAVGSCQYPTAMLEHAVSGASYERLGRMLDTRARHRPQCVLLVGDQIYVDGTAGLFDPTLQYDRYVRPYELFYRMESVRHVLRRLPAFMMMDDHEIRNNWEPRVDDTRVDPEMIDGRHSYLKFERHAGPNRHLPVLDSRDPIWYPFQVNGFSLFMADTRTERTPRTAQTLATARIMSVGQHASMLRWLRRQPRDAPKIIASPAILLPRHARAARIKEPASALRSDSWDGYPRSLHGVLAFIARNRIPNVVFVSGDEHLGCVATIKIALRGKPPVLVHSVHSSPLFAPFPFANTEPADLVADDRFDLDEPTRGAGHCSVQTEFAAPGDGFAVLRFYRDGARWVMHCEFDRAREKDEAATIIECNLA